MRGTRVATTQLKVWIRLASAPIFLAQFLHSIWAPAINYCYLFHGSRHWDVPGLVAIVCIIIQGTYPPRHVSVDSDLLTISVRSSRTISYYYLGMAAAIGTSWVSPQYPCISEPKYMISSFLGILLSFMTIMSHPSYL